MNHSHGSHVPGFGRHGTCVHDNKELVKAKEILPLIEDSSNCDIVKATQYGIFERCKELVEAGYDVRQPDKENVSLLHWAAINNRLELVKFYISKGAVIDQLGGDLNSTPLHWAIRIKHIGKFPVHRQGHLPMVILLLQHGADPTLIDGEGFSSIHLAVLFQHMPIIAYLISKGQSVNMTDVNGQTPLMLSAYKVIGAVDKTHQNTPLHWAVAAGNVSAVDKLLEAGSSLDIRNAKGETPLDMALQSKNQLITHMLRTEAKMRANKKFRLWRWLHKCESLKMLFLLLILSMITLWAVGYILDFNSDSWLLKGCLLVAVFFLTSLFPSIMAFLYFFYKTWATDPGFTKASEEERKVNIVTLAETGSLDFRTFCTSCLIRKPLRSLHCHVCNSCVARFDQHCFWTGRCIGFGNHHHYIFFLLSLSMVCDWIIYGSFVLLVKSLCHDVQGRWTMDLPQSDSGLFSLGFVYLHASSFPFLMVNIFINKSTLSDCISGPNLPRENQPLKAKQAHETDIVPQENTIQNLGFTQNLADFFQCGCFGLVKPCIIDWTSQYTMVFHPAKEKVLRSV
ncbi:Palmitoyltransferase ZDHHC13 [Apodemus speciosus]|uniref:Palmitoyltransferase n=1 Tax=Apodemus speciosus TaxID=105296 RepID=A0ABQ0EYL0_APOSI